MTPPDRRTFSEAAAFAVSSENSCRRTFVSKNALLSLIATTGIGLEAIELEVLGDNAPVFAQPSQHLFEPLATLDLDAVRPYDPYVDLGSLLEAHNVDDCCGQSNCPAVAPLGDFHDPFLDIHPPHVYLCPSASLVNHCPQETSRPWAR